MRLLLQLNYDKFLLPEDCDATAVLEALSGAVQVEEKHSDYSAPASYAPSGNRLNMEAKFIQEPQIISQDDAAEMDIGKLKKDNARLHTESFEARDMWKNLYEKFAA